MTYWFPFFPFFFLSRRNFRNPIFFPDFVCTILKFCAILNLSENTRKNHIISHRSRLSFRSLSLVSYHIIKRKLLATKHLMTEPPLENLPYCLKV